VLLLAQTPAIIGNFWLVRMAGVYEMSRFVQASTYANVAIAALSYLALPALMIGIARRHRRLAL
jgi:hypothetical protein